MQYTHYVQERLAVTAGVQTVTAGAGASMEPDRIFAGTSGVVAAPIGVNGGYNWMIDFAQPVGTRDTYSGPEFGISFGWLFGRGRATP